MKPFDILTLIEALKETIHPNVPLPHQTWSNEQTLHVAVAYSNPFRSIARRELFNNYRQQMECMPNVVLHVGELAYGDRPFEVTNPDNPLDLRFRTHSELFHKENIINLVVQSFPEDWLYGCYTDGDFTFTRADWALETIHQLQHHSWVQPYSTYAVLGPRGHGGHRCEGIRKSFAETYIENGRKIILPTELKHPHRHPHHGHPGQPYEYGSVGATGGAWAFRRHAFEAVGGLLDVAILGHADWFMAFALVGELSPFMHIHEYSQNYQDFLTAWREHAKVFKANVGVVDAFAVHHFHGHYKNRGYETRDQILVKYQYDPIFDLIRNSQGIYELAGNKPKMREAIMRYFINRREDDTV